MPWAGCPPAALKRSFHPTGKILIFLQRGRLLLAPNGHGAMSDLSPLSGAKQKSSLTKFGASDNLGPAYQTRSKLVLGSIIFRWISINLVGDEQVFGVTLTHSPSLRSGERPSRRSQDFLSRIDFIIPCHPGIISIWKTLNEIPVPSHTPSFPSKIKCCVDRLRPPPISGHSHRQPR